MTLPVHQQQKRRLAPKVALVSAALLALAGCSPSGGSDGEIERLVWAMPPVSTLDMDTEFTISALMAGSLSLEGLTRLDKDGTIEPALAESVENPDPTTYIYTLREATFWDGEPVTAADVVHSMERHLAPESAIAGQLQSVDTVTADDEGRVVVTLKYPDASWPIAASVAAPVTQAAHADEHADDYGSPEALVMGTGPWKIASFQVGVGVDYERNDDWWGGEVPIDEITLQFVNTPGDAALGLRSGEIDGSLVGGSGGNIGPFSDIPGVTLDLHSGLDMTYFFLNPNIAPFDDPAVRIAIAHAIDRDGMVTSAIQDEGTPVVTLTPPALLSPLADAATVDAALADVPTYEYDLELAKEALARSTHPDGFTITTEQPSDYPAWSAAAQVLAEDLAQIGITLEVNEMPLASWYDKLLKHEIAMTVLAGTANIPDPALYISAYLSGPNAATGGLNWASHVNPAIDLLLEEQAASEGVDRLEIIAEILSLAAEDSVYTPLWVNDIGVAISDRFVYSGNPVLFYQHPWGLDIAQSPAD